MLLPALLKLVLLDDSYMTLTNIRQLFRTEQKFQTNLTKDVER